MGKILITCILIGSWAVPGFVSAPQHAKSQIDTLETIEAWLCPEPPQPPSDGFPKGKPASVGIKLLHYLEFDGVKHKGIDIEKCVVEGEVSSWSYQCPGLNQYQEEGLYRAGPAGWFSGGYNH